MAFSKFVWDGFGGDWLPIYLFWLLKSELGLSISIEMSPLRRMFEHSFHKNHIKTELELSISSQLSPSWSLYEHPFHNNDICPKD